MRDKPQKSGRARRRRGWALAALGFAVSILLLSPPPAAAGISFQTERELGRKFDLEARRRLPLVGDPEIVGYVDKIGQKIVAALDDPLFQYHFSVVRDPAINAFAVPGGYVYVNTGLLIRAANDDEVAAVLGHEIGHVHAHHMARLQESTQLLNYATLLGMLASIVQPAIAPLVVGANAAVSLKYTRQFEQEADYLGVRYVKRAGYDPRAMLDFFRKLADQTRTQPTFAPPYLQSHPLTDERLNHLEAVLRTQQWAKHPRAPTGFELRRVQVLARSETEPPTDLLASYRRAVEQSPADPMARYLYGVACVETGQLESGRDALEAARKAGIEAASRELGEIALRQRRAQEARQLLAEYLKRQPGDAGAHTDLAKTYEALGDNRAAMDAYRRAVQLAPDLEAAHYGLGILAGRSGNEADGFYHLATAARLGGHYEKALQQYARAKPLLPAGDPRAEEVRDYIDVLRDFTRLQPASDERSRGDSDSKRRLGPALPTRFSLP
jgi:predicted Zn-dependent protease